MTSGGLALRVAGNRPHGLLRPDADLGHHERHGFAVAIAIPEVRVLHCILSVPLCIDAEGRVVRYGT